ncbi:hypothetical protein SLIQ_23240 [Serratia liquefaciens FK01]|nr:hypothetical protein SLIQ_23240 [Serratia liquefaciens FK01]
MTKWSVSQRYSGLAHRGALRRASRYDPYGTLSLITSFVSSLRAPDGALIDRAVCVSARCHGVDVGARPTTKWCA